MLKLKDINLKDLGIKNKDIKYDEANSITYFVKKMEGGFKQLTYYNAAVFINE